MQQPDAALRRGERKFRHKQTPKVRRPQPHYPALAARFIDGEIAADRPRRLCSLQEPTSRPCESAKWPQRSNSDQ
jgi:hypothetical protein